MTDDIRPRTTVKFGVQPSAGFAVQPGPGDAAELPRAEARPRFRDLVVQLLRHYVLQADRTADDEAAFDRWSRERFVDILRVVGAVFSALMLITWVGDLRFRGADQRIFDAFVIWRSVGIVMLLPMAFIHRLPVLRNHPMPVAMLVYLCVVTAIGYSMGRIGGLDSPWFYVLYATSWVTVIFPIRPVSRLLACVLTALAGVLGYFVPFPEHFRHPHVEVPLINLATFTIVAAMIGHVVHHLLRDNFFAHREAEAERARAERLLHATLPEPIARRLHAQKRPGPLGDRFEDVTVLFADIVGFTGMSQRVSAEVLVRFLNQLFTKFDRVAEQHGLEKIKTLGDGYVVAGGLPEPRADHAAAVAEMALDLIAIADAMTTPEGERVQLRIGIQSGPAVAGVIGVKKLTYDIWGDTVNTAARLESHGVPGRIQVGDAFYQRMRDRYHFESRGEIDVKGKGTLTAYFLVGRLRPSRPSGPIR
ncbi:MAG TPA: adenylate/guanylate cyclase domain-containing protein [Kofleriaceae bacterium]|nr:adenylate/guanylate cyclase domain-containing protein [Kofleriaceae bacterium]